MSKYGIILCITIEGLRSSPHEKMKNTIYTVKNAKTSKVRQLLKSHYAFTECDSEEQLLEELKGLKSMPIAVIADDSDVLCSALASSPTAFVTIDSDSGAGDGNLETEGLSSIKAIGVITAAVDIKKYVLFAAQGKLIDRTDIKRAAESASLGNQVYLQLYANELHEAIFIYDFEKGEVECNEFGSDMFGLPRQFGNERLDYLDKLNVGKKTETVRSYLTSLDKSIHLSLRRLLNTMHGTRWFNIIILSVFSATGEVIQRVARLLDIDEMIATINKWHELADRDSATGLFNRAAFEAHCNDALNATTNGAVVFIDMDNFKTINDSYGHNYGDRLIKRTAARIRTFFEEHGYEKRMIAGRIGGDEFGVCITNYKSVQELRRLFNTFCEYITEVQPALTGRNIVLTASVGVSLYPEDGNDIMTLIEKADVACYNVKANLKNGYAIFANEMVHTQGKPRGQRIDEYTDIIELKDLIKSSSPEQILTLIKSMTASGSRAYNKVIKILESTNINLWEADFRNETIEFLVGERDVSVTDYQSLINLYAAECVKEQRADFLSKVSQAALTKIAKTGRLSEFVAIDTVGGGRRIFEFELRPSDIDLASVSVVTHYQTPDNRGDYFQSDPILVDACLQFLPILYYNSEENKIIYANEKLTELLGYSSFKALYGKNGGLSRIFKQKDIERLNNLSGSGEAVSFRCADKSFVSIPIGYVFSAQNRRVIALGHDDYHLDEAHMLDSACNAAQVDFVECHLTYDDMKFYIKSRALEKWLATRFKLTEGDDDDLHRFLLEIKPQLEMRMRSGEKRFEFKRNGAGFFLRYVFKISCEYAGSTSTGELYHIVISFDASNDSNSTDEDRRIDVIIAALTESPEINRAMILRELKSFYRASYVDVVDDSFFGGREHAAELLGESLDTVLLNYDDPSAQDILAEKDCKVIAVKSLNNGYYCVMIDPVDYRPLVYNVCTRFLGMQSPTRGMSDVIQKLKEVGGGMIAFSVDVLKSPPYSVLKVRYVSEEASAIKSVLNEPGACFSDLVHPDDCEKIVAAITDAADGVITRYDCRIASNGGYVPAVCNVTSVSGVTSLLLHETARSGSDSNNASVYLFASVGAETHAFNTRTGDMVTYVLDNGVIKGKKLSSAQHALISNGRVHSAYKDEIEGFLTGKRDKTVYRARVGSIYKWKRGACYHTDGDIRYFVTSVVGRLSPEFKLDVPDLTAIFLFDLTSNVAFRSDKDNARMTISEAVDSIVSRAFGDEHKLIIERQINRVALLDSFDAGRYYYYTEYPRVGESGNLERCSIIVRMHVEEQRICATIAIKNMSEYRKEAVSAHSDSNGFFAPATYENLIKGIKSHCGELIITYENTDIVRESFGDHYEEVTSADIAGLLHYYLPGDAIISRSEDEYRVCLPSYHDRLAVAEFANKISENISPAYYERRTQMRLVARVKAHMIHSEGDYAYSRMPLENSDIANSLPLPVIILEEGLERCHYNTVAIERLGAACETFTNTCREIIKASKGERVFGDPKKGIRIIRAEDNKSRWYLCLFVEGIESLNDANVLSGIEEAYFADDVKGAINVFAKYMRSYYEADGIILFGEEKADLYEDGDYSLTDAQRKKVCELIGNNSVTVIDDIHAELPFKVPSSFKSAKNAIVLQLEERVVLIVNPKRNLLQHKPAFVCARAVAFRNREQRLQDEIKYKARHDPETGALVYRQLTKQFGTLDGVNCVGVAVINFFMMPEMRTELDHERFVPVKRKIISIAQRIFGENGVYALSSEKYAILCYNVDEDAYYNKLNDYEYALGSDSRNVSIGSVWEDSQINLRRLIETAREFSTVIKRYDEAPSPQERSVVAEEIEKGYYQVYLQPKLDLNNDSVTGAEALVRKVVDGEVVSPGYFIPIMEQNGETYIVDLFVLDTVCAYIKSCDDEGLRTPDISVNFSRQTVLLPDASERAKAICEKHGVSPSRIEIEITESIGAISLNTLKVAAAKLHDVGFNLSLDDFGAEYSSYAILSAIDFSVIKIDKSMINNIVVNERARLAVRSIIDFCHNANINCLAEGVETYEQKSLLSVMSCDLIQGYITNKPMPISNFTELYLKKEDDMF